MNCCCECGSNDVMWVGTHRPSGRRIFQADRDVRHRPRGYLHERVSLPTYGGTQDGLLIYHDDIGYSSFLWDGIINFFLYSLECGRLKERLNVWKNEWINEFPLHFYEFQNRVWLVGLWCATSWFSRSGLDLPTGGK